MRLTEEALKAINTKEIRPLLALALKKSEGSIIRYITENSENGDLTKTVAVRVIMGETGLMESEILEEKQLA